MNMMTKYSYRDATASHLSLKKKKNVKKNSVVAHRLYDYILLQRREEQFTANLWFNARLSNLKARAAVDGRKILKKLTKILMENMLTWSTDASDSQDKN